MKMQDIRSDRKTLSGERGARSGYNLRTNSACLLLKVVESYVRTLPIKDTHLPGAGM